MVIRFNKVAVQLDCEGEDPNEPVFAELTVRGDLVFHNWDRAVDAAALELGFKPEQLPCLSLEENYYRLFDDEERVGDLTLHRAWKPLLEEALRVKAKLRLRGEEAIATTGYRIPALEAEGWKPLYREPVRAVHFDGLNPNGLEAVEGDKTNRMARRGDVVKTISYLSLCLNTTVQAYLDVVRFIPSGLVWEKGHRWKKDDVWAPGRSWRVGYQALVAAVEKVLDDDSLIVVAGRQLPDMRVESQRALVTEFDSRRHEWVIEQWLP